MRLFERLFGARSGNEIKKVKKYKIEKRENELIFIKFFVGIFIGFIFGTSIYNHLIFGKCQSISNRLEP